MHPTASGLKRSTAVPEWAGHRRKLHWAPFQVLRSALVGKLEHLTVELEDWVRELCPRGNYRPAGRARWKPWGRVQVLPHRPCWVEVVAFAAAWKAALATGWVVAVVPRSALDDVHAACWARAAREVRASNEPHRTKLPDILRLLWQRFRRPNKLVPAFRCSALCTAK